MAKTTLEQLVQHVKDCNGSPFGVDFKKVADGLDDACRRIETLEQQIKFLAPKTPKE